MAEYDIKLNTNQLVDVLSKNDAIKELLESVLNQVLASQMTEHLGAEPHEQTAERVGLHIPTHIDGLRISSNRSGFCNAWINSFGYSFAQLDDFVTRFFQANII